MSAQTSGSLICTNFAQNAWKKDLCSNCFKSEVEHRISSLTNTLTNQSPTAPMVDQKCAQNGTQLISIKSQDIKCKTTKTHTKQDKSHNNCIEYSMKSMTKAINQKNINNSVNECQNTTTTDKKAIIKCNNNNSPQKLVINTKKINSNHVSTHIPNEDKSSNHTMKDILKDNGFAIESNNSSNVKVNTEESSFDNKCHLRDKCSTTTTDEEIVIEVNDQKDLSETVVRSDSHKEVIAQTVPILRPDGMSLVSILRTDNNRHLIKYRPKNKCLVFKEGDPLIIGADDEYYSDGSEDEDQSDDESDDLDDEQIYYSDDRELRELTRVNTKFNSNFANFAIVEVIEVKDLKVDQKINSKINSDVDSDDCPADNSSLVTNQETNDKIPEVCEKLLKISLTEGLNEINSNSEKICIDNRSSTESPSSFGSNDYSNSDVHPMSTSSDCYSSSSGDEKEDTQTSGSDFEGTLKNKEDKVEKQIDANNLEEQVINNQSLDNNLSGKEVAITITPTKHISVKPELPAKPNLAMLSKKEYHIRLNVNEERIDTLKEKHDDNVEVKLIEKFDHCDIKENDKLEDKEVIIQENNNYLPENEVRLKLIHPSVSEAKRDIKLAELAHELEQVRQKRPAPQPPQPPVHQTEDADKEDICVKYTLNDCTYKLEHRNGSTHIPIEPIPTKPHRFSIRKLLHKKNSSDKLQSAKGSERHCPSPTGPDPKAWKQSEFDRTNLKIVHPIDLAANSTDNLSPEVPEQRPEVPPRTPKLNRPSAPARRRKQSQQLSPQPPREEPPVPPVSPTPSLIRCTTSPICHDGSNIPTGSLDQAYNELSQSVCTNLLAIKSKIESISGEEQYKWSDFEVTNGIPLGKALLYEDSIVSNNGKTVNLLVLPICCYCPPIIDKFINHSDLVIVLNEQWTIFKLLPQLTLNMDQKLITSLILQLFAVLEYLETNGCKRLSAKTIDNIIVCSSGEDCLLVVPLGTESAVTDADTVTLGQFLFEVLAKLMTSSVFESVSPVLSRPDLLFSQSKAIVQSIAFQVPFQPMSDPIAFQQSINFWLDISRSKFLNKFFSKTISGQIADKQVLTQLDYIYLNFLCNYDIELIADAINLVVNDNQTKV